MIKEIKAKIAETGADLARVEGFTGSRGYYLKGYFEALDWVLSLLNGKNMEQDIRGVYDLTENALDIWASLNPGGESEPEKGELDKIRQIVQAHYWFTGKRLGQGHRAWFDECGTWTLPLRKSKTVRDFQTGQMFQMPEYLEMEFNAEPTVEEAIAEAFTPPTPEVK